MSRKEFIESEGATCKNWTWSWSFINADKKIIIFSVADQNIDENGFLILSQHWKTNIDGRKKPGYSESIEHIRLIQEEGYELKIFHLEYFQKNNQSGPSVIKSFTPELTSKILKNIDGDWYACDATLMNTLPEELDNTEQYIEGASTQILVNAYERNPEARKKCLQHHGYQCAVCLFDFEKSYGSLGKNFIHIHHLIPLSEIKQAYIVDPVKDLRPVCPNCHAMIHMKKPPLSIDDLKQLMPEKDSPFKA